MGNIKSLPDTSTTDLLSKFSHFRPEDITLWLQMFKKTYPSTITRTELDHALKTLFPFGNCSPFASNLFRTINISQSSHIDISEFLISLSILTKGSKLEKLRWVFRFMDSDDDGVITKNDMTRVVISVYDMIGCFFDISMESEKTVEKLFEEAENESGFLTFEDLKFLVENKPEILNCFVLN